MAKRRWQYDLSSAAKLFGPYAVVRRLRDACLLAQDIEGRWFPFELLDRQTNKILSDDELIPPDGVIQLRLPAPRPPAAAVDLTPAPDIPVRGYLFQGGSRSRPTTAARGPVVPLPLYDWQAAAYRIPAIGMPSASADSTRQR